MHFVPRRSQGTSLYGVGTLWLGGSVDLASANSDFAIACPVGSSLYLVSPIWLSKPKLRGV